MVRFFVNGKDLKDIPVSQNEKGEYYALIVNSNALYKPVLADFDNATPPFGYKKYYNGSHVALPNLERIDMSCIGTVTADQDVKINGYPPILKGFSKPYGVNIMAYPNAFAFNHTNCPYTPGTIVKAGQPICYINTKQQNAESAGNFPSHLEIYTLHNNTDWSKQTARECILTPVVPVPPVETCEIKLAKLQAQYYELQKANELLKVDNEKKKLQLIQINLITQQ